MRLRRVLLRSLAIAAFIVGAWLILGTFFATQDVVFAQIRSGGQAPIEEIAIIGVLSTILWMLFTPIVAWLAQARRPKWPLRIVLAIAVCLGAALVRSFAGVLFVPFFEARPLTMDDVTRGLMLQFHSNVTLAALVVIARILYDAARAMREKDRRALTLETQLARAQLEQLRGQLQPHFLFNAINGIAALVHTDPELADEMLMQLAALLRSTLDLGRSDTIPLRRELELVDHYLRIQTMRFHDRLQIRRSIDASALACEVPALLLQPLLENSLRHVVAKRAEGGLVELRVARQDGRVVLRVSDDGPGFDPATAKLGVGVSNTIARLEQLYRGDARIQFDRTPDAFVVTIDLPAKESA